MSINLNNLDFTKPELKVQGYNLDTRISAKADQHIEEVFKNQNIKISKSELINKILLEVFDIK